MGNLTLPSRRNALVRTVAASWRQLTSTPRSARNGPGEPTLIACSGGGDSSALAIALTAAAGRDASDLLTLAHIVHDLRPPAEALADRDRAAELARSLGLHFVEAAVAVKALPGNAEANARRARYAALCDLAHKQGARFIATAHNSHDQAESVLMALLRGSGPRGLAGVALSRRLAKGLTLIRPMLTVSPDAARDLCTQSGWTFARDLTNNDPTRLRNALRADILPRLLALRPGAEHRIATAAQRCKEADDALVRAARRLLANVDMQNGYTWPRPRLRTVPPAVLGETLRRAAAAVAGPRTLDRLPARTLTAAVRLIRSDDTDPKTLDWSGVAVNVNAHTVRITAD